MKVELLLQNHIQSYDLKRLVEHLAKLKGFEFIIDPNYDCKIIVKKRPYRTKKENLNESL